MLSKITNVINYDDENHIFIQIAHIDFCRLSLSITNDNKNNICYNHDDDL